jgi:hypothetical protein
MRLPLLSALLATLLPTFTSAQQQSLADPLPKQSTLSLYAWPLTAASPRPLAEITYDHNNALVKSYTPPLIPANEEIVRIGFYPDGSTSGSWSGIATAASNLKEGVRKTVKLLVDGEGRVWHIGFEAGASVVGGAEGEGLGVVVVPILKGEAAILNKPIVVAEDGQVEGKEPEKTFLQK